MFLGWMGWEILTGLDLRGRGQFEEVASCFVDLDVLRRGRPLALTLEGGKEGGTNQIVPGIRISTEHLQSNPGSPDGAGGFAGTGNLLAPVKSARTIRRWLQLLWSCETG